MGEGQVRRIHNSDRGKRRTKHLESLPHWLLIQDVALWIRIITVLYALHVLNKVAYEKMFKAWEQSLLPDTWTKESCKHPGNEIFELAGRLEKGE
jgi:hypothetical protein